jgi:hypothetical protein
VVSRVGRHTPSWTIVAPSRPHPMVLQEP